MKKMILAFIAMNFATAHVFGQELKCFETRTGKDVLYVADDLGSITTGSLYLGKYTFDISNEKPNLYSYNYGKNFKTVQNTLIGTVIVEAKSNSHDALTGYISIFNLGRYKKFPIICSE